MSLKGNNEKIEKLELYLSDENPTQLTKKQRRTGRVYSDSSRLYKKQHRRWLRNQYKKDPEQDLENCYHGYEY